MLKDEVALYSQLTGRDGLKVPVGIIGAYLDGYERGKADAQPEIVRCKDCKHFEYDHVENVNGIPLIVAHEICMRWGDGAKTSENGYCFLAERSEGLSRLDDTIGIVAYILDTLMAYRRIVETGDCNSCSESKNCKYVPKLGEQVRYNCPFYEGEVTE